MSRTITPKKVTSDAYLEFHAQKEFHPQKPAELTSLLKQIEETAKRAQRTIKTSVGFNKEEHGKLMAKALRQACRALSACADFFEK